MRVIKINVELRDVYEIDIEPGLKPLYNALDCDMVDILSVNEQVDLVVDEEGLLRDNSPGGFVMIGMPQPYAGHGLLIGRKDTEDGLEIDSVPGIVSVEDIRNMVTFIDRSDIVIDF